MESVRNQWAEKVVLDRRGLPVPFIQEDSTKRSAAKCLIGNRLKPDLPLFLFEHIFGSPAHRADPSVGKFFKGCARRDITVRIALLGVVNITANLTFPFFHLSLLSGSEIKEAEGDRPQRIGLEFFFHYFSISSS